MESKIAISYIRVSTQKQGESGLGLDAQRAAIALFCRTHGFEHIQEFREIESGKNDERPALRKAIARTKAIGGLLLIAKIDRLARSVYFVSGLMRQVDFRACDYPDKDPFMMHIRACVAEEEARAISARTKAALQAAKARGKLLGAANPACRKLTQENRQKGAQTSARRKQKLASEANAEATVTVTQLRAGGMSLPKIAAELDARGITTRTGKAWNPMGVLRLLRRAVA
jgi:DNA invertase Pin-like site-specific DNA recombinase